MAIIFNLFIFLLVCGAYPAHAWLHHGNSLIPRVALINLSSLTGGEGAFINNIKNCNGLSSTPSTGYAFPLILNADGYPTSTPANVLSCGITAMPQTDNPDWIVSWSGTLQIVLLGPSGTATIKNDPGSCVVSNVSGSLALGGTNCTVTFAFSSAASSLTLQFPTSGAYSNPSGLYMVRSDEKSLFDAGEIFRPISAGTFLAKLSDMGVSVLRFIDWSTVADGNNTSQWSSVSSSTVLSYANSKWELASFPGTADSGVSASPVDCTDYPTTCTTYAGVATTTSTSTYVDGQVYQNIVTHANTNTAPTLSVGGGAVVTIVDLGGSALSVGAIANGQLATFVYLAKPNKWMYRGGGITSRMPIPIETALCNKLSVNCWYQFPQTFTTTSMAAFTAHVRGNLSSSLTAYFEFSNEVFNCASASPCKLSQVVGTARGFPDTTGNFTDEFALSHRIAMGIVTDNWYPRSMSTLVRVMSWIIDTPPGNTLARGAPLKLDASRNYCSGSGCTITERYDTTGACSATNTTSGEPVDCTDAFAYAPYYNGAQMTSKSSVYVNSLVDLIAAADNYASGNSTQMAAALDWADCDIRGAPTITYPFCGYKGPAFTGTIANDKSLTVSGVSGTIAIGQTVFAPTPVATITAGSGLSWTVDTSLSIGPVTMRSGILGSLTMAHYALTGGVYESYNTSASTFGKYVVNYEGGYQGVPVTSGDLAALGVTSSPGGCLTSACVAAEILNLLSAYKNDSRFSQLVYDQWVQFKSYSNSRIPGWYNMGPSNGSAFSVYGAGNTIATTPFQSYNGIKNYATGR